MFKKKYLLNLVNIYSKFIGLVLFTFSLLFFKGNILALIISMILVILTFRRKHTIYLSLFSLLLSLINIFYPHILWIIKIIYLIIYLVYLSDLVDIVNAKRLYEKSLYGLKSNFVMKIFISLIYFMSLFKKNFRKLDRPRIENGLVTRFGYFISLSIKSYSVTKEQINNIILYHKIRFYNIENRRTSIDDIEYRNYDFYYIGMHVLILIISIVTRFV